MSRFTEWGEIWDSNPCVPGSQPGELTTSPISPACEYINTKYLLIQP